MKIIACFFIGLLYLFTAIGCERVEEDTEKYKNKAIETYKKVKDDAKERAQEAKENVQDVMREKARKALKTQDRKTGNGEKQE